MCVCDVASLSLFSVPTLFVSVSFAVLLIAFQLIPFLECAFVWLNRPLHFSPPPHPPTPSLLVFFSSDYIRNVKYIRLSPFSSSFLSFSVTVGFFHLVCPLILLSILSVALRIQFIYFCPASQRCCCTATFCPREYTLSMTRKICHLKFLKTSEMSCFLSMCSELGHRLSPRNAR